jgi:hypothetical protein
MPIFRHGARRLFLPAFGAVASFLAAAASSSAQTGATLSASPETMRQMQQELQALRAEEAAARAAEQRRSQRIEALARQLGMQPSPPPAVAAAPAVEEQVAAAPAPATKRSFEIYGFAEADYIQDFKRMDQNWDAAFRPSKIPTTTGDVGSNGQSIISARQSRFGAKASADDVAGLPLFAKFEFDLFGTGVDEGQTTFRLRHAYGSWGPVLAGQTNSTFMDIDTFPNVVDYWGPNGMVFLRTPQIRYTYKTGPHEGAIALEYAANDIDPGNIRVFDPALGSAIRNDEKFPDIAMHYRYDDDWGHVQLAALVRRVGFDTPGTQDNEPKGHEIGWGLNLSSNVKTWGKDVLHVSGVYGEGIASYMNDGGTDLGPKVLLPLNPLQVPSLEPAAVPIWGFMAYYDHYWSDEWSTSLGYSQTKVDNTNFQEAGAFQLGEYTSANLLYQPDPHILIGAEFLWGRRKDKDGASGDDSRLQATFKYTFSSKDFLP